jgi:hypothetical protein
MPLENLTGGRYISDLNENWPAGTDLPDAGDDHLRGLKNVLKKTFPSLTGPVTLTQDQINRGSVPSGSILPFYQAAAPAGWTRVSGITQTYGIRIVATATAGGVAGGADDPVLNDKVPTHTHSFSTVSGGESADHNHAFSAVSSGMNANASHNHGLSDPGHGHNGAALYSAGSGFAGGNGAISGAIGANYTGISISSANIDHAHSLSGNTGGRSSAHTHAVSGTADANGSAASWVPRYVDMILCARD